MNLTPAQLATLKTAIAANANVIPAGQPFAGVAVNELPNNSDGNAQIAWWYNQIDSPDFWVWRTLVSRGEYVNSVSVDGTTFNWTGAGFITRSQGERDAWREMFNHSGTVNPSLANVRQAFTDIFSGATAPAPANRTHLSTVSRRRTTRAEHLFATGTGSTASPAVMSLTAEGDVSGSEVEAARNLP